MGRMMRRYAVRNRTSTLHLFLLIGHILTGGVMSKSINHRNNINALSKSESNFGKYFLTTFKNDSVINDLPLISSHTPFHLPVMSEQELLSRMKITGQQSTSMSPSSDYTFVGVVDQPETAFAINPTTALTADDTSHNTNGIYRDYYFANAHGSTMASPVDPDKISHRVTHKDTSYGQNSLKPSFDSYESKDTFQMALHDITSETETLGDYSNSDLTTPILYGSTGYSSMFSVHSYSGYIGLFHVLTNNWSSVNTDIRPPNSDFTISRDKRLTSTKSLPLMSSVFDAKSSLPPNWQYGSSLENSYSTVPVISTSTESQELLARTKTIRSYRTMLHDHNLHKTEYNTNKPSSQKLQHRLLATNEQITPSFRSTIIDMSGSSLDNFDSLVSAFNPKSSDLFLGNVNAIIPSKTVKDSLEGTHLEAPKEIMASTTAIEDVTFETHDSQWKSSVIPTTVTNDHQYRHISSQSAANDYSQKSPAFLSMDRSAHSSITLKLEPKTGTKANNLTSVQTRLRLGSDIDSPETIDVFDFKTPSSLAYSLYLGTFGVEPIAASSSLKSNKAYESTRNHLAQQSQIETLIDNSDQMHSSHFIIKSTQYDQGNTYTPQEFSNMFSTDYLTRSLMKTERVLNSDELKPFMTRTTLNDYSLMPELLSTMYESKSSSSQHLTSLTPSSPSETLRHFSNKDVASDSLLYVPDSKSEASQHAASEENTDMKDIVVENNGQEIKIEININNNIIQEERESTTVATTTQKPPQIPLELMVICAYMCHQRGSPIPPFCGCTLQAWLR